MKEKKTKQKNQGKIKGFFADFKAFINKGNVLQLAIAVVIGGAFGKIVSSLVADIVMPLITLLVGGSSVNDWKWVINPAQFDADGIEIVAENALRYGIFIQAIIDFLIIALFIFLALRIYMSLKKRLDALKEHIEEKTADKQAAGNDSQDIQTDAFQDPQADPAPAAEATAAAEQPPEKPTAEQLLTEIRDLLKSNKE